MELHKFDYNSWVCIERECDPTKFDNKMDAKHVTMKYVENLIFPSEQLLAMPNIQSLEINNCNLNEIPDAIFSLKTLKSLWLMCGGITHVPDAILNLDRLESLSLSANKLTEIPPVIFQMHSLQELSICNCPINILPDEISNLANLKHLLISSTNIASLPKTIGDLPELKQLIITSAPINTLPIEITKLKKMYFFNMRDTLIDESALPSEIIEWFGTIHLFLSPSDETMIKDKYISTISPNCGDLYAPKKIIVKETRMGLGVFADEDIPARTIFYKCEMDNTTNEPTIDDISRKINDLAWHGDMATYHNLKNIKACTNVMTMISPNYYCNNLDDIDENEFDIDADISLDDIDDGDDFSMMDMFSKPSRLDVYLASIRDIKKGEELSRFYGRDFWSKYINN